VDGTKLVAAAHLNYWLNYRGDGMIYTSADSGATWTQTRAPSNSWSSVASSVDGTKLVAAANLIYGGDGLIYTSADSGATWTRTSAPSNYWSSVASSADGTKVVAVARQDQLGAYNLGAIYTSGDSGSTWMPAGEPAENWVAVASSADGSKLMAATARGPMFTLQFPIPPPAPAPSRRLTINSSGGSLRISWLVPSTSFVLQQSFDLGSTNWTEVPTPPTLNFTNLHYQVIVAPSLGARFYRLKQP
jgi:hypothetical protein